VYYTLYNSKKVTILVNSKKNYYEKYLADKKEQIHKELEKAEDLPVSWLDRLIGCIISKLSTREKINKKLTDRYNLLERRCNSIFLKCNYFIHLASMSDTVAVTLSDIRFIEGSTNSKKAEGHEIKE